MRENIVSAWASLLTQTSRRPRSSLSRYRSQFASPALTFSPPSATRSVRSLPKGRSVLASLATA